MTKLAMLARAGLFCGVAAVSAVAGQGVASRVVPAPAPAPPPPPQQRVEEFNFDSATVRLSGRLAAPAAAALREASAGDTALVLLVERRDLATCEDLGRQLRELRRHWGPDRKIVVWGEADDPEAVRDYLKRERIAGTEVQPLPVSRVMEGRTRIPTPAVLVATAGGVVVEGVAHPYRFKNVRLRSWSQELRTLPRAAGEAAPSGAAPAPGA